MNNEIIKVIEDKINDCEEILNDLIEQQYDLEEIRVYISICCWLNELLFDVKCVIENDNN